MSSAHYERLPTEDKDEDRPVRRSAPAIDPRFHQPTPAAWKRVALLAFIVFLFWLAFSIRTPVKNQPKIVHSNRYSKDHRFRPAASPVITERLKDGRTRLRGAQPTF